MIDCIFCKLVAEGIGRDIAYEDDDIIAFPDRFPKYKIHILIIPKKHLMSSIAESTAQNDELVGKILRIGAQIAKENGLAEKGFRLLTNTGGDAGQSVPHLHVHLLGGEKLRPV
jgi:histidine triad (HIT) family protein